MRQKIQNLLARLNHGFVERDSTLKAALLAVLAGENVVLIGPPGTGKSMLARRIADNLTGAQPGHYFEYLLTKFSTPEELFGPLSISALKRDVFERNTSGYLPSVQLAFLDEIFKASSSILNALLTILNERMFHNGAQAQPVPLQALIAASNELPTGQEELDALYDRFLLRCFVGYVSADGRAQLLTASAPEQTPTAEALTAEDLATLHQAARVVSLPPTIEQALLDVWRNHQETFKEDARESLSDRRLMKCLGLLRVAAASNDRSEVDLSDLLLLQHCLWNHPDNAGKVLEVITRILRQYSQAVPLEAEVEPLGPAPTIAPKLSAARPVGQRDALINGFLGRGTPEDPLLIQSVQDLMELFRPEVGGQGYYFRVTQDIDCSTVTSWLEIDFIGHLDGGDREIIGSVKKLQCLFHRVSGNSTIKHLKMKNYHLTDFADSVSISYCSSSASLIKIEASNVTIEFSRSDVCLIDSTISESNINYCTAGGNLIEGNLINSKVISCKASGSLVKGISENSEITSCSSEDSFLLSSAVNCTIKNCSAKLTNHKRKGFFAGKLNNCIVEKCFVFGKNWSGSGSSGGAGFVDQIKGGVLKDCVVGIITNEYFGWLVSREYKNELKNNYSIDTNKSGMGSRSDASGAHGQSIPVDIFNQRFFENVVGWDFKNIWYWDDVESQPALRNIGANAEVSNIVKTEMVGTADQLLLQARNNIWI